MAITIKGIRLESISLKRNEDGGNKIETAEYSLISSVDKVLAKQTVGGYGGMVLEPSRGTVAALDAFITAYRADVVGTLGLEE